MDLCVKRYSSYRFIAAVVLAFHISSAFDDSLHVIRLTTVFSFWHDDSHKYGRPLTDGIIGNGPFGTSGRFPLEIAEHFSRLKV
jgi:hypothetical protein